MTGDQDDMLRRLKALLPAGWFGGTTPILDALLSGPAWLLSQIYAYIQFFYLQTRLRTLTGGYIDLAAYDFLGSKLLRKSGQSDAYFRALFLASILREAATRAAVVKILTDLTGRAPVVHENGRDGPFYGVAQSGGYGTGQRYSTVLMPYEGFVDAYRPLPGTPQVGVTDADIYAAVTSVKPAGTDVWVRISD